jgi:hypothetical protein
MYRVEVWLPTKQSSSNPIMMRWIIHFLVTQCQEDNHTMSYGAKDGWPHRWYSLIATGRALDWAWWCSHHAICVDPVWLTSISGPSLRWMALFLSFPFHNNIRTYISSALPDRIKHHFFPRNISCLLAGYHLVTYPWSYRSQIACWKQAICQKHSTTFSISLA